MVFRTSLVVFTALLLFAAGSSYALWDRYPPFPTDAFPASCEAKTLSESGDEIFAGELKTYPSIDGLSVEIRSPENAGYMGRLVDAAGNELIAEVELKGAAASNSTVEVVDLSNVQEPDFVIRVWAGGNELAWGYARSKLIISSGDTYRPVLVDAYGSTQFDPVTIYSPMSHCVPA